ncbi:HNH endonuclease signature motif containing protein [Bifidobacterium sp.]|uniref:HNH endonuclease signature motif containing protein n=1 Tax=Bifidobacterium sp. TaxID=41200 RepID=UPI00386ADF55
MPRGKRVPDAWLVEHYARGTIDDTRDAFEAEFGWRPTRQTLYVHANRLGLHKDRECSARRKDAAQRVARWSAMPEESAWMAEHDHGQRTDLLSDEFEAEFGWRLNRNQVNAWRARTGTQPKGRRRYGGRPRVPVGTERPSKDGYVVVKVADEATVSMSKDNWKLKHVHVWEQANGRPLPKGSCVYFADGDRENFDPANLVEVPRRLVGVMNGLGIEWHDAASLRAVMAMAEVRARSHEVLLSTERTCAVCGARFVPTEKQRWTYTKPPKTCPDCLAKGKKAGKGRKYDQREILALVDQGLSQREVAEQIGCCVDVVRRARRERER